MPKKSESTVAEETVSKVSRAFGSLVLVSLNFFSAVGIVLLGGFGILPRYLVSLAAATIIMSIVFLWRIRWVAGGRGRGWVLMIVGLLVFIVMAKLPQTLVPLKPMSLLDMVQPPLSWNLILVSMLLVLGFFVAVFSLARRR